MPKTRNEVPELDVKVSGGHVKKRQKGYVLHKGESQRADGRYVYTYTDRYKPPFRKFGNRESGTGNRHT